MIASISISRRQANFKNKTIVVYTDNISAASIINKCSSKNFAVMHALRDMFLAAAAHNCVVRALYMPGHRHVIADCISRLHEPRQFNSLESIINKWYLCHTHKDNDQYSMLSHMSMSSLCTVLKQAQLWRKRYHDWKWT